MQICYLYTCWWWFLCEWVSYHCYHSSYTYCSIFTRFFVMCYVCSKQLKFSSNMSVVFYKIINIIFICLQEHTQNRLKKSTSIHLPIWNVEISLISAFKPIISECFTCTLRFHIFFKDFIYLLLERGKGGRKRNIDVWLPLEYPLLGTWPATQACVLNGNWTNDLLVHRLVSNQLSHTSQGQILFYTLLLDMVITLLYKLSISLHFLVTPTAKDLVRFSKC